jgi:hypothetical protein
MAYGLYCPAYPVYMQVHEHQRVFYLEIGSFWHASNGAEPEHETDPYSCRLGKEQLFQQCSPPSRTSTESLPTKAVPAALAQLQDCPQSPFTCSVVRKKPVPVLQLIDIKPAEGYVK